jgi:hypothetical protein
MMNHENEIHATVSRTSFWKRLGGGALTTALCIHAGGLVVAGIWYVSAEMTKPAAPQPSFRGGQKSTGDTASAPKLKTLPPVQRIAAMNGQGTFTLPEMEIQASEITQSDLVPNGSSFGSPGGPNGNSKGSSKMGPDRSGLDGDSKNTIFGTPLAAEAGLLGTFYDLKQSRSHEPNELSEDGKTSDQKAREVIREFVSKGFKDSVLKDYYQASVKLYQTKLLLPEMTADAAPAAFQCEKEVQPKRWVVVYRGEVKAPKSGKFRFVGAGDDCLVVRFNSRLVFDHGYTSATLAREDYRDAALFDVLDGKSDNKELIREVKKNSPMEMPTTFYTYASTGSINQEIHGYAVGPVFEVRQGQTYPIEILISEIPGGRFQAGLMIQEEGVTYDTK